LQFTGRQQETAHNVDKGTVSPRRRRVLVRFLRKRFNKLKRLLIRRGFIYANVILIVVVAAVVWIGNKQTSGIISSSLFNQSGNSQSQAPLDALSSADIADNVAIAADLPEAVSVTNQADSYNAQLASATVDEAVVTKPQLVAGGSKSRQDIQTYITVASDTVSSLAVKFGITSNSIIWSNNLTGNNLSAGKRLLIPPVNGIVYLVKSGDTVQSIANTYQADPDLIVAFNDIELSGLPVGQYIMIPNGTIPATSNGTIPATSNAYSSAVYDFNPEWGGNGYTFGYCTWYVASMVAVPRNWGNADTWAYYARLSGWTVSPIPIVGAIAQTTAGWAGHVALVFAVSPDHTMIKYSDMNGIAGFDRVGYSGWVPSTHFQNYIYH
jgi:surface antigen